MAPEPAGVPSPQFHEYDAIEPSASVEPEPLTATGRVVARGLFDADHLFVVEPLGADGSRLIQQEQFSGLLVPFFQRSLDRSTLPAFHAMNQALKARAERATATPNRLR